MFCYKATSVVKDSVHIGVNLGTTKDNESFINTIFSPNIFFNNVVT